MSTVLCTFFKYVLPKIRVSIHFHSLAFYLESDYGVCEVLYKTIWYQVFFILENKNGA